MAESEKLILELPKYRLTLSTSISVLLHLFVFFSLSYLLRLHINTPAIAPVDVLEVRFSPLQQNVAQPKVEKRVLTRDVNPQFKITQPDAKKIVEHVPQPPVPVTEAVTPPTQGIALPGAIAMPWQLPGRSNNSAFHPPPSQQNAERTYYQQAMEAQARQRNEYQARLIMQQLQQLLARVLDVKPAVEGTCNIGEVTAGTNPQLECDSPALYEVIAKTQMDVIGMMLVLRGIGTNITGFTAEVQANSLRILLNQ